jgi:hypothetical protein
VEPIPPNSFPDVVSKELVSDTEARELFHIFFSGCHLFIPLFDPSYDTYEGLKERTPFCFDAILAVASKIRAGNGPPSQTFYKCLEEAQGIARSTLFGPVVRKEAVQGQFKFIAISSLLSSIIAECLSNISSDASTSSLEYVWMATFRSRYANGARSRVAPCVGKVGGCQPNEDKVA